MVEHQKTSSVNPNLNNLPPKCDGCKSNLSKYKCPGCSLRSCSLTCVKAHKQRTGCTGKRQLTHFVPISQFDDNLLISDYNMLEDVKRVAESAQRMRVKLWGYSHFRLPYHLKSLRGAALSRRTRLTFLSCGMSKREANSSFYNNRKKLISWTIEWRFHSTDVILTDHGVLENTNLSLVIEKHLKPGPWSHPLKQFCMEPLESLKFFICKYPKGRRSPFRELDIKAPLREQLANLVIIEYPVILVYLPSHSYDFEVVKDDVIRPKILLKEPVSNREPSPKGVSFREEEIKDDNSSETQVLDLMEHVKPDGVLKVHHQTRETDKELNDKNDVYSSAETMESGDIEGMDFELDFDFEQGLIDAYSNLISEANPDDFLDLEGVLNKEVELEERRVEAGMTDVPPMDELEEGEIPGF